MSGEATVVCLVHHSEALGPKEDPQQPLSIRGRAMAEELARDAATRGVRPGVIWHSGKLRARQTAEAFWRVTNPFAAFKAVRGLQSGDPPAWMRDQLAVEEGTLVLVGHMPHIAELRRLMVPSRASEAFPQHGMVCLVRTGTEWDEQWCIAPTW